MSSEPHRDKLAGKVPVLGDVEVGKTSIVHRYVNAKFENRYVATIGVDILSKTVQLDLNSNNYEVELSLWDIAGQDHFKLIRSKFYRKAVAALLIFDVTKKDSFNNLQNWIDESSATLDYDIPYVLVGNKIDLDQSRVIDFEMMKEKAKNLGIELVIETSALTGENINKAFDYLATAIINSNKTI